MSVPRITLAPNADGVYEFHDSEPVATEFYAPFVQEAQTDAQRRKRLLVEREAIKQDIRTAFGHCLEWERRRALAEAALIAINAELNDT